MMMFRTVKNSILNILQTAEAGRYVTIGYQGQLTSVDDILNEKRRVQVRYKSGDFSESKGRLSGPKTHEVTYEIILQVAKAAKVDKDVLENPNSSNAQRAAALAAVSNASIEAENSIDEFCDIIYQVLMSSVNYDMGLSIGQVTNRWINNISKGDPVNIGEYEVTTAKMNLNLRVSESVEGATLVAGEVFDTNLQVKDDPNINAGTFYSSVKNIESFTFNIVGEDVTIDNQLNDVYVEVPNGTDVTNLTPIITTSERSSISPLSGVARDFSTDKTYSVTANDLSVKIYTVHVLVL